MKTSEMLSIFDVNNLTSFKTGLEKRYHLKDMVLFTESNDFGYSMVLRFNTRGESEKIDKDYLERELKRGNLEPIMPRMRRANNHITVSLDCLEVSSVWEDLAKMIDDELQPHLI